MLRVCGASTDSSEAGCIAAERNEDTIRVEPLRSIDWSHEGSSQSWLEMTSTQLNRLEQHGPMKDRVSLMDEPHGRMKDRVSLGWK